MCLPVVAQIRVLNLEGTNFILLSCAHCMRSHKPYSLRVWWTVLTCHSVWHASAAVAPHTFEFGMPLLLLQHIYFSLACHCCCCGTYISVWLARCCCCGTPIWVWHDSVLLWHTHLSLACLATGVIHPFQFGIPVLLLWHTIWVWDVKMHDTQITSCSLPTHVHIPHFYLFQCLNLSLWLGLRLPSMMACLSVLIFPNICDTNNFQVCQAIETLVFSHLGLCCLFWL